MSRSWLPRGVSWFSTGCLWLVAASGCGGNTATPAEAPTQEAAPQAAGAIPSAARPQSLHATLLQRQLDEQWAFRTDKDGQVSVPLADAENWKRVRYWAFDHLVGFKYGADMNALNVVMTFELPVDTESNPRTCMRVAEKWGRERLRDFQVQMGPVTEEIVRWSKQNILVHRSSAEVALGFKVKQFSAAWAAYPAYARECLLFAQAVPWDHEQALAEAVLDRWIREGAARLTPLTDEPPRRK